MDMGPASGDSVMLKEHGIRPVHTDTYVRFFRAIAVQTGANPAALRPSVAIALSHFRSMSTGSLSIGTRRRPAAKCRWYNGDPSIAAALCGAEPDRDDGSPDRLFLTRNQHTSNRWHISPQSDFELALIGYLSW